MDKPKKHKVPQPLAEALLADMDFPDEARKQQRCFCFFSARNSVRFFEVENLAWTCRFSPEFFFLLLLLLLLLVVVEKEEKTHMTYCWWKKSCTTYDARKGLDTAIKNAFRASYVVQDFFHQPYDHLEGPLLARFGEFGPPKGQFFRDRDSFFLVTYIPSLKLAASFPLKIGRVSKGKYII